MFAKMKIGFFGFLALICCLAKCNGQGEFSKLKATHRPQQLGPQEMSYLASLSNVKQIDGILDEILIPRVVNTSNHEKVFAYIVGEFQKLGWHVDVDEFQQRAPILGTLTFKNVIATLNPRAERFLTLACHYDSKYFKDQVFVGATDSAVPCAMLLNLATILSTELESLKRRSDLGLMFIFFDGEEAFHEWGPEDSIYGAKHLAREMSKAKSVSELTGEHVSNLDRIDMLMLLDLIGAPNPTFYSYFKDTEQWFLRLAEIDEELSRSGLLKRRRNKSPYFKKIHLQSNIEDDHLPFLRRGVPVLHLIVNPFPKVWHTAADDRRVVDLNTVEDLNKIFAVFIVEYFNLLRDHQSDDGSNNVPGKEL